MTNEIICTYPEVQKFEIMHMKLWKPVEDYVFHLTARAGTLIVVAGRVQKDSLTITINQKGGVLFKTPAFDF